MRTDGAYDIIVVGAGVAGSTAATTFARQGYNVLLLERSLKEPDRIVGELLQPGGIHALAELGLHSCLDDIDAIPVKGYHIYWKDNEVSFSYPPQPRNSSQHEHSSARANNTARQEVFPRAQGKSFHHGRFVSNLRSVANVEARVTMIERRVTSLTLGKISGAVKGVECLDGEENKYTYQAPLTIVADGSSSNFRSHVRADKPHAKSRFWGLELEDVELPFSELAYGVIGSGPPVLIYQIGTHETRILIDIPYELHAAMDGHDIKHYINDIVVPTLPSTVGCKVKSALQENRLRSMANQWLPASSSIKAGVLLLGDSNNMRHPLTGGGMTVALKDIVLLSKLLHPNQVSLQNHEATKRQLRKFQWQRKWHSASLNILAQALYVLFVADDYQLEIMQHGFVRYIQQGGSYADEPAGLMGGVYQNPLLLLYHFFAIALYSIWLYMAKASVWMLPVTLFRSGRVFGKALNMILPFIISELWS